MCASVPQSDGDFNTAGGGTCVPITLNNWPMKPSGVQFAIPIRPPLRKTRSISCAVRLWSGGNIAPNVDSTTSKLAAAKG